MPSTTRDRRLKLLAGAAIGLGLLGGAWLLMRPPAAPGGALPIARPAETPPAPAAPAPALARPAAAPAPPVEPPALTAPRRLEDDPGRPVAPASATPARPARGGAPAAGAGQPLRDPYAAPADPLKADPYR